VIEKLIDHFRSINQSRLIVASLILFFYFKGNTIDGNPPVFNWTLPEVSSSQTCVLRIRYNISTNDYSATSSDLNKVNTDLANR